LSNWWNSLDFSSEEDTIINKDFDFIHNWYKNRKYILDEYGNKTPVSPTTIKAYPDVTQVNLEDALGIFNPIKNTITLSDDFTKIPHIYTHEINHKYQSEMDDKMEKY